MFGYNSFSAKQLVVNICVFTDASVHANTVNKEAMHVKKSMVGCVRGFGEKKRKKEI